MFNCFEVSNYDAAICGWFKNQDNLFFIFSEFGGFIKYKKTYMTREWKHLCAFV